MAHATECNGDTDDHKKLPFVDQSVSLDNVEEEAKDVLHSLYPEWEKSHMKSTVFNRGRTNAIVGVTRRAGAVTAQQNGESGESDKTGGDDDDDEHMKLVRVYGKGTEKLIDRDKEIKTVQRLASLGISGVLYARFKNGFISQFIPGVEVDKKTVRDRHVATLVAKSMAKMHAISLVGAEKTESPILFKRFRTFVSYLPDNFDDAEMDKKLKKLMSSKSELSQEVELLEKHLSTLDSPLVLCHNDLLLNNVLYNEKKDAVYFIDMEYAAVNYQAYEIANHFAEYCGFDDLDFSLYPDRDYQLWWIRNYLSFYSNSSSAKNVSSSVKELLTNGENEDNISIRAQDVERMYVQVQKFALVSHLFWAVWAVVQQTNSTIDFGFFDYGCKKYAEYKRRRDEFLNMRLPPMQPTTTSAADECNTSNSNCCAISKNNNNTDTSSLATQQKNNRSTLSGKMMCYEAGRDESGGGAGDAGIAALM